MSTNESRPLYELYKEGVSECPTGIGEVIKKLDPVLIALVMTFSISCWIGKDHWLPWFIVGLIFLWGLVRYIEWPKRHRTQTSIDLT